MSCLFCSIATHEIESKIRFENDEFVAFDDINPTAKVHILIVPKKHIHSIAVLEDSDSNLIGKLILVARDLARELGIDQSGYRLIFNSGPDAGQLVDHLHLHLIGGQKLE